METKMTLDEIIEMEKQKRRRSIIESFSVKERLEGLRLQDILEYVPAEELFIAFESQKILAELTPKERLHGLTPREIVEVLEPEDMLPLLEEINKFLGKQEAPKRIQVGISEFEISDEDVNTQNGVQN